MELWNMKTVEKKLQRKFYPNVCRTFLPWSTELPSNLCLKKNCKKWVAGSVNKTGREQVAHLQCNPKQRYTLLHCAQGYLKKWVAAHARWHPPTNFASLSGAPGLLQFSTATDWNGYLFWSFLMLSIPFKIPCWSGSGAFCGLEMFFSQHLQSEIFWLKKTETEHEIFGMQALALTFVQSCEMWWRRVSVISSVIFI